MLSPLQDRERGGRVDSALRRRRPRAEDVKGSVVGLAAAGPGRRPAGLSCLLGSDSGLREALRCFAVQPHPPTFSLTYPPGFSPPPASLSPCSTPRRFTRVRNKRLASVTVLKETQSRELSGSCAAERRYGWRPGGVPTPSGDHGLGAARPAAHHGANGTAGQQRLLQVPCASAAASPCQLLRWNLSASTRRKPRPRSWPGCPKLSESAGSCCSFPDPLARVPSLQVLVRGCPGIDFDNHN
uniref:Uncharacterized protein n=1 Tax=Catagonus wagneri TaxID=51154 RepID=A0A8C3W797_9CETA